MANRYNRTDFLKREIVDGVEEFDLVSNSLNDFRFLREKKYYTVVEEDIQRPDLIAIKSYGSSLAMNHWHIVMYVNNIGDVWNDLYVGQILLIPDKKDIEDFIVFNRNRK